MRKTLVAVLCAAVCLGGLLRWHFSKVPPVTLSQAVAVASKTAVPPANVVSDSNAPVQPVSAAATTNAPISRELDIALNPYAAGLREPGKSKREWDAGYIKNFQTAKAGDPVKFELTAGVLAHPEIADVQGPPQRLSGLAGVRRRRHFAPVGDSEREGRNFHAMQSFSGAC